ncbi:peptidoglycan-binding domain-containing protein [Nitrosomonas halophila]|uniref:Putative peptidoglycan binding domain-containing protein n=1 Tax=Nitrosomonas halophila TaxID=44576 RepID=A0A1H3HBD2_9PROT|nr:peptidoglycan-binding domain-containing protein [Nitrosomonas halophila]SDY12535.1 Putative peptidoglycan binding domain-containing protein [Nitrosomonas halophila]
MRTVNLDSLVKGVLPLVAAAIVSGCGGETEEVAKQDQDPDRVAEFIQSEDVMPEPIAPVAPVAPAEPVEETLESILEKADEIIQRTESSIASLNEVDTKAEPEEIAAGVVEEPESLVALATEPTQDAAEAFEDGLEVVKTTPELIRKVQQALMDAGFNAGAADGLMGPRTMRALTDFQQQHQLAKGELTKETLRELGVSF